jgi:transposase
MINFVHIPVTLYRGGAAEMNNWKAQLMIFKGVNMKPNFSELARNYGVDRRTIKKYWEGYQGKPKTKGKISKLDNYKDLITEKLCIKGTNIKATHEFMLHKYPDIGTYSNFSKYIKKNKLFVKAQRVGHPRFETEPGHQAQVDWKENMEMISRHGELFVVNVFNFTLGYSRRHYFEYSRTKDHSDVFRCLYNAFKTINGVPKELLFDNMTTAAVNQGKSKRVNPKMALFAKECGFIPRLCKVRHSYTKGKVEASNKFLAWLLPYQNEFENEEELIEIIRKINDKANAEVCQGTNIPPILLFQHD